MARRRVKKRTHIGSRNGTQPNTGKAIEREPKSMVIRIGAGEVGPSITQLTKDMRQVMEPGTATKLKVCIFASPTRLFTYYGLGAKKQQAPRLHDNVWTARSVASTIVLEERDWKHKHEDGYYTARTYPTF